MATPLSKKTFLIVDDFADMRSVLRNLLRSLSVNKFDLASNGREALLIIQKRRPDIILCDYNLGEGKDGQQVLEEARERNLIGVDNIFAMLTAENTREMVMAAVEYVPDTYLTKPFTAELLKTRLERLIQQKSQLSTVNDALVVKDYNRAIDEINTLLANEPINKLELIKIKAEALVSSNRFDEALAIYNAILRERDDLRWARLGQGKALFLKKDYPKAEEALRSMIRTDRNVTRTYDLLARVLMAQGRYEEAEKILELAVELSPRALKRQIQLGDIALKNGNSEAAEIAFNRAMKLSKHSMHNHPSIHSGLAQALAANGKHIDATKIAGEIGRNFPGHQDAAFYQATATATIKANEGSLQEAALALEEAEKVMKNASGARSPQLGLELIKIYSQLGYQEKVNRVLQTAIANNHDDEDFLAQVQQVCHNAGISDTGKAKIDAVRQEIIGVNNAGVRLIKKGEFDAAINLLRKAADELPANKTVNLNAAKAIIMKMEQQQQATTEDVQMVRRYMETVQDLAPDDWRLHDVTSRLQRLLAKV